MKEEEIKIIPQLKYVKYKDCDDQSLDGLESFVNELKSFLAENEKHSVNVNYCDELITADLYSKETVEEANIRVEKLKELSKKLKAKEALRFLEENEEVLSKLKSGVSIDILKTKYD